MRKLIILCGIPGSGKTTFAKKFIEEHKNAVHISRDEIRFKMLKPEDDYFAKENEVVKEFYRQINKALDDGYTTIADATFLSKKTRKNLLKELDKPVDIIMGVEFLIPLEECLNRNALREGRARVPRSVIKRMWHQKETLSYEREDYFTEILKVVG